MKFLFAKNNGTFGITSTDITDILAEVQPEDIIDGLDCIGIRINRYFDSISNNIDYILWISQVTEKVMLKAYAFSISENATIEEDVEEFKISNKEIQVLIDFLEI